MARSNPANCQYVVDVINKKLGTAYTVASGTGQRWANKNYLAGWIDKANGGSSNYASQVTYGTKAINCGTVDDEVQAKIVSELKIYLRGQSAYSSGIIGFVTLKAATKEIILENSGYRASSWPTNITSTAPTCIGGYISLDYDGSNYNSDADQKIKNYLTLNNWDLLKTVFVKIKWVGESTYYGGEGFVQQYMELRLSKQYGALVYPNVTALSQGNEPLLDLGDVTGTLS